eukprot:jgi/Mesvir1/8688/Mv02626-RA.1
MQLRHLKCILPPQEGFSKVTSLTWSSNNQRLAAVTTDRVVHLFDENGERKDKFSTKPGDSKGPKNYIVRGMAWSPDSTRLAIAQSDNTLFVYKLGLDWGEKKSICNKFHQSSSITCVVWPNNKPNEVVYGLAEGKIKIGILKSNKPATLYAHPEGSYVVSICATPDGNCIITGHLDGSLYRYYFDDGTGAASHGKLVHHVCVPYALACGISLVAAGSDCKVVFYSLDGVPQKTFDYSSDEAAREMTTAAFNPSGETVVVGSFNRYYVFSYNIHKKSWEDVGVKVIDNYYTVTALEWKPDGSRLSTGSLCGAIDLYDACIRRQLYQGKFEFTYVSNSQVIVKRMSSGTRIVLKSHFGYEVQRINIYRERFLVGRTPETLLLGDLESCKLSEVPWNGSGNEKYFFDNEQVCMIYNAGELSLVEYGTNELLASCRTEHMSPYLISVRLNEARGRHVAQNKKIAYLIDLQTIRILDLLTGSPVATISHDMRIDWLELNRRGTHLLYRDKGQKLHLYNLQGQERTTLLNYCSYVQWVPDSDVVVGQNRGNLCVWYNINTPERVTVFPIKGDVEDIERSKGRTEVVVDEGINTVSYALDESLIDFGSAIDDHDYAGAIDILDPLELTPETEAMWQQLSKMALDEGELLIAERCFAALGDIAKARYLHKINKIREKVALEMGTSGMEHFQVKAKLALLQKQYKMAEMYLLEQGKVDETMQMYTDLHRWEEAIDVAEAKNHPDTDNLRRNHYQWLLQTGQEESAARVKEKEGDYLGAISLYLKGGLPGRAAQVVNSHSDFSYSSDLLESIAASLSKAGMHEKAGDFFEKLGRPERAKESFRKGKAFRRAVELARRHFPHDVVVLEGEWGDWLAQQKQLDAAINHYIEAGQSLKAIDAAIEARQWSKAVQIVEQQDQQVAIPYYKRIARHYEQAKSYEEAERYYVQAEMPSEAVEMYSRAGKWEAAHRVAVRFMSDQEMTVLYTKRARELEAMGKYKDAEKTYLTVKEHDLAINMYKKAGMFDHMIRLVSTYRKDLLAETHIHLGQKLQSDGLLRQAEHHYLEAKDWRSCVSMYREVGNWEEAIRIAKAYGGPTASKQLACAWAAAVGGEEGARLLTRNGLVEQAIEYAMESGAFALAFELTRASMSHKLPEVHLKYAMFLEDEGRFKEAEEEFAKADKPKEAIDMYMHQQDWGSAMRVAEMYDPASIPEIQVACASVFMEQEKWAQAEQLFLRAKKPELALQMYRDQHKWEDAIRIAEDYIPSKVQEVHLELSQAMRSGNADRGKGGGAAAAGGGDTAESLAAKAAQLERQRDFAGAIECLLKITVDKARDADYCEEMWVKAVNLAMTQEKRRTPEVVGVVSRRLVEIGRLETAAELNEGVDMYEAAIDIYIKGNMWDKAKALGEQAGPTLKKRVDDQYMQHLMANEKADDLVEHGNVLAGIDLYARQGDWNKVHELARQQGPQVVAKYALRHAKQCVQAGEFVEAVDVFARYGTPCEPAQFELYKRIAREVVSTPKLVSLKTLADLKEMFYKLVNTMRASADTNAASLNDMERMLRLAHYSHLKEFCKQQGMMDIAAKLSVSLLRYIGDIPADKAFYEAGVLCKEIGVQNLAFVFLNRYLDLTEAMDDGSAIENSDFVDTDIPYDFALPEVHYLDEEKREEVRDKVLELSMNQQVDQSLTLIPCDSCGSDKYIASLVCPSCKTESIPCIVTGYPVTHKQHVMCKSCDMPAVREDFNTYVVKCRTCPWCNNSQNPIY